MPKFFVTQEQIDGEIVKIVGQDVNHIKNVLREKIGNKLTVCNISKQENLLCEIIGISENLIECKIKELLNNNIESNVKVTIMQGLPKADKMELIIQKSVELGVYNIIPIEMKRCVVKLTDKDKNKKIQRWQKIAEVASKQCGRDMIPKIEAITKLKSICNLLEKYDIVLVAYENEKDNTLKHELKILKEKYEKQEVKIAIIIGPEGGIELEEVQQLKDYNVKSITLGKRILRTETVALNVLSIIMYELEN